MTHSCLVSRRAALKVGACAAALLLLAGSPPACSQQSPPEPEKARQIAALVDKTAALIDSKGKFIFPEFRKTRSEWRNGDTYLSVADTNGMKLFNAAFPKLEETGYAAFCINTSTISGPVHARILQSHQVTRSQSSETEQLNQMSLQRAIRGENSPTVTLPSSAQNFSYRRDPRGHGIVSEDVVTTRSR
jgi:hypothetical protein